MCEACCGISQSGSMDLTTWQRGNYLSQLRSSGHGATSGQSALKASGFMHGCFTFANVSLTTVISGSSKGVCSTMLRTKSPLKQAVAVSSDLFRLERAVAEFDLDDLQLYFGGIMLFCIYSSSRFSDAATCRDIIEQDTCYCGQRACV